MNIIEKYNQFCASRGLCLEVIHSVRPYDDSTLFCPAGMQKVKKMFMDETCKGVTKATAQHCIRVDDLNQVGDGIHFSDFYMLGLFSFRNWSLDKAITFWLDFMKDLEIVVDEVHIHPDKFEEWKSLYPSGIKLVSDPECKWTDGEIGGYCTEFYVDGVEIGNIVNPLGDCIDVGFGLERLENIVCAPKNSSKEELIIRTIKSIVNSGYVPGNKKQGYVLRKLLRLIYDVPNLENVPFLKEEIERQRKVKENYERLKLKYPNQSKEWWFDTHGIEI